MICVRPPGGTFRAPVAIGRGRQVEVAAGGWVHAVAYRSRRLRTPSPLRADDRPGRHGQPDARVAEASTLAAFAIDGAGNATAVWTDEQALRTARRRAGAALGAAAVVRSRPTPTYSRARHVDLAVSARRADAAHVDRPGVV